MSIGTALGGALGSSLNQQVPVVVAPTRGFATAAQGIFLTATATLEESAQDEQTITQHPVEYQAAIGDHTYAEPGRLSLRLGWSLSDPDAANNPTYLTDIYQQLLSLKSSGTLLTVYTGKRVYQNMLIQALAQVTDSDSEYALFVTVSLREIIIATTQVTTVSSDQSVLTNPQANAPVTSGGTKQPVLVTGVTPPPG